MRAWRWRFRLRAYRPAWHCTLRRRLRGRRGVRRADLLRASGRAYVRREAGTSEQHLLVSGQAGERGLPGAERETTRAGAAGGSAAGEGDRNGKAESKE